MKFKEILKENLKDELNEGVEETLLKEINKKLKMMKRDVGTNNFRGAVQGLKAVVDDYMKND